MVPPDPPAGGFARAAQTSLRFLLIVAAAVVIVYALIQLRLVVLPVVGAILIATVLVPVARRLHGFGLPPTVATLATMFGGAALIAGLIALIVPSVAGELDDLGESVGSGIDQVVTWLADGPLGVSEAELNRGIDQAIERLGESSGSLAAGVLSGAQLVAELIAGLLLMAVLIFFFVKDGPRIWGWVVSLLPARRRDDANEIGARAWAALGGYVRGVSIVATVDAVLIGLALLIIGVPLVLPLMVLTFMGAFFPLVGALLAGAVAALVALVSNGVVAALVVVAVITLIQQVEGDLLYPLVVGRSVELHPVAILLALTAGAVLAGVIGALLAVPAAAVAWVAIDYLRDPPPPPAEAANSRL